MIPASWPDVYPRDLDKGLVPRDAHKYPWIFKCGTHGCFWTTAHRTQEAAGKQRDRHIANDCPHTMPVRESKPDPIKGTEGETVTDKESATKMLWDRLVEETAVVVDGESGTDAYLEAQGAARATTYALHCLLMPAGGGEKEIKKLAYKYFKAQRAGTELPALIGVGGTRPSPTVKPTDPDLTQHVKPTGNNGAAMGVVDLSKINATTLALITNGLKANFDPANIAKLAKVKADVVEAVRATL